MEIYTMNRPWTPLTPACAPSALMSVPATTTSVAWPTPIEAAKARPVAVMAAERAPVSREHQVQVQAELAQALLLVDGINGTTSTTGFVGIDDSKKRYADGGSGVPPRGRPV